MAGRPVRVSPARGGARPYQRGAAFERTLVRDLQRRGFSAWRTPGSRSSIDVIALAPGELVLVQAKCDGRITDEEKAAVLDLARWLDGRGLIAVKMRAGYEYRDALHGELWNGVARWPRRGA